MSGENNLEQQKKEAAAKAKAAAAAKAKAAALAKMKANQQAESQTNVQAEAAKEATQPQVSQTEVQAEGTEQRSLQPEASGKAAEQAGTYAQSGSNGVGETVEPTPTSDEKALAAAKAKAVAAAKAKAAAAAKAKAAALAKQAEGATTPVAENAEGAIPTPDATDEKAKAIAAAKAKAAAVAKAKAAAAAKLQGGSSAEMDEKAIAIAEAKAAAKAKAAAAAKAKAAGAGAKDSASEAKIAEPSPNQPFLDKYVHVMEEHLGKGVLEDSYINNLSKDVPTLVTKRDTYYKVAEFLKYNEQLGFDYLSELHGSDFETHMEVYLHLYSYKNRQSVAIKVKIDRDTPEIESVEPLWAGANWPECEAFDLLGINFIGHPNLHRIMLGEDWVGHPLRKDYEQYDVEV